jgi:uncharacterized protein
MRRALLVLLLPAAMACTKTPPQAPLDAPPPAEQQSGPRVILPNGTVIHVEIAANDEMRAQGLMYRDRLRDGTGMLFFFPADGEYPFWMKNTRIPLDMIWIDAQRRVVHIKENVPPCQVEDCPNYAPNAVARYVLELNGGAARQYGLKVGDVLQFEGTGSVVAR